MRTKTNLQKRPHPLFTKAVAREIQPTYELKAPEPNGFSEETVRILKKRIKQAEKGEGIRFTAHEWDEFEKLKFDYEEFKKRGFHARS
jgi:hypothetical protein